MPTGRERREQLRAAADRILSRRDGQASSQGEGRHRAGAEDGSGLRDFGLTDPRDPQNRGPGGHRKPVDVNVVGNPMVMRAMEAMLRSFGEHGRAHGDESRGGQAHIGSSKAAAQAAQQLTREMRLSVEATERLAKVTAAHTESMSKAYAAERAAVTDLTRLVSDTVRAVRDSSGPDPESEGEQRPRRNRSGAGTGRGMGPEDPHRPASPFTWPGSFSSSSSSHYDPGGLLDRNAPIHGGARNDYMGMMSHIAGGGHPDDYQPGQAGRNHPTSYGELKRNLRVRAGRFVNERYGEPNVPTLTPQRGEDGNVSGYLYDRKDGTPAEMITDEGQAQSIAASIAGGAAGGGGGRFARMVGQAGQHLGMAAGGAGGGAGGAGGVAGAAGAAGGGGGALGTAVHAYTGARLASQMAGGFARAGLGGAVRAVPGLGWAMAAGEAVNEGAEWITEQRAANARYQSIEGGGNVETGVPERLRKFGNRMYERFTGGMTGEQSDQLFDTLTSQGFRGPQRSGYLTAASRNYKQYGMDPMQSAQLITEAANHANSGLTNMAESIRTVTDAAVRTGVSADTARGKLLQNLQQLEANGVMGDSGMALAAGETSAVLGMGRSMQGVSLAGLSNELPTRMQAAQQGMGYGQFVGRRARDPMFAAQSQDQFIARQTQQYTTGRNGQLLNQIIDEHGGREALKRNPDEMRKVVEEFEERGNVDFSNAARQLAQAGVEGVNADDPTSAGIVAIQENVNGGRWQQQGTERSIAENSQRDIRPEESAQLGRTAQGRSEDSRGLPGVLNDLGHGVVAGIDLNPFDSYTSEEGNLDDPAKVNATAEQQSGRVDPYIDRFISPESGVANDENSGVKVHTKDGDKVVPMATALRQYRDQIADGTAVIVGGAKDGQTVKQVMGGKTEQGFRQNGPPSASQDAPDDAAEESDWRDDHGAGAGDSGGDSGGSNVKVTVEPGPSLQNWFRFNTGSGSATEGGAAGGAPTTPGGLPTTGGGTPPG